MDDEIVREISVRLSDAELNSKPIDLISARYPDLTERDAYRIAKVAVDARSDEKTGFKLGFTSEAMRSQMRIEKPNYGYLTRGRAESSCVDVTSLIHPLIEPEIALLTGKDIAGAGHTRETVFRAVEAICPSLEIVDTRYKEYRFTLYDNIADNSSSARYILGSLRPRSRVSDLRLVGALFSSDGKIIDYGIGANVLGDPLNGLAWLANALSENGEMLPAGSIVLTGGLTRAYPLKGNETFVSEFAGLGVVHVHVYKCSSTSGD